MAPSTLPDPLTNYGMCLDLVACQLLYAVAQMIPREVMPNSPEFSQHVAEFIFDLSLGISANIGVPVGDLHNRMNALMAAYLEQQAALKARHGAH